jgi:hypothetical protein
MSPKHHHMPLSGGDRKALTKELSKSRAMTKIFAERSAEKRREGEALIREADNLACQSWNERMWSEGGPIDGQNLIWLTTTKLPFAGDRTSPRSTSTAQAPGESGSIDQVKR